MVERPILFSGPMVRAILAGQKTQTRRLMKPQPEPIPDESLCGRKKGELWWPSSLGQSMVDLELARSLSPYGGERGRLWVRENFASAYSRGAWGTIFAADGAYMQGKRMHPKGPHYNADDRPPWMKWRPSIHMPRWASRLNLVVQRIRAERLQDITEEDAIAEGVDTVGVADVPRNGTLCRRDDFAQLWDIINGNRASWESNPWVWVIEFQRLETA